METRARHEENRISAQGIQKRLNQQSIQTDEEVLQAILQTKAYVVASVLFKEKHQSSSGLKYVLEKLLPFKTLKIQFQSELHLVEEVTCVVGQQRKDAGSS